MLIEMPCWLLPGLTKFCVNDVLCYVRKSLPVTVTDISVAPYMSGTIPLRGAYTHYKAYTES